MTKIGEFDLTSNTIILRDMTDEEMAQQAKDLQEENDRLAKVEEYKIAAATARNNRISAYEKLGLTQAEIDVLVPPLLPEPIAAP